MSEVILRIKSSNAALVGEDARAEVVRILRDAANDIAEGSDYQHLYDINGNKVGSYDADIDEDSGEV